MESGPKRIAFGVGIALVVYLALIPLFWPQPTVSAVIPDTVSLKQDPEMEITVRAWHSNVDVSQVRFYADFYASTAKGPNGLFDPALLLETRPREFRGFLAASPITRPWSKRITVTLPIREFTEQGLVGPGILEGKLDVTVCYATKGRRHMLSHHVMESVPFRIVVNE